jgi:hypothetical protein
VPVRPQGPRTPALASAPKTVRSGSYSAEQLTAINHPERQRLTQCGHWLVRCGATESCPLTSDADDETRMRLGSKFGSLYYSALEARQLLGIVKQLGHSGVVRGRVQIIQIKHAANG